jgi:hypothetical protein
VTRARIVHRFMYGFKVEMGLILTGASLRETAERPPYEGAGAPPYEGAPVCAPPPYPPPAPCAPYPPPYAGAAGGWPPARFCFAFAFAFAFEAGGAFWLLADSTDTGWPLTSSAWYRGSMSSTMMILRFVFSCV